MPRSHPFSYKKFKEIYSQVPKLCVDLMIKKDNKVLLTLRTKNGWENQWHLPGGTVYYREAIEDAAKRVAKEELGLQIKVDKFLGYIEWFSEEKERGFGYSLSLVLLCTSKSGKLQLDDQVSRVKWFSVLPENTIKEQKDFLQKL